jgi:aconitate hydratase
MGVLPLEFLDGQDAASLQLTGDETISIRGVAGIATAVPDTLSVTALRPDGSTVMFDARVRIDTPGEAEYFRHGGILPYVLRQLRDA